MVGVSTSNSDYVDLLAERGSEAIVSELKGHPSSPGLDDAIGYGQSLRRMDPGQASVRYSLVVPPTLRTHVTRVHQDVLHAGVSICSWWTATVRSVWSPTDWHHTLRTVL